MVLSVLQGINPNLKDWPYPFLPSPSLKKNPKSVIPSPPFLRKPPQNFREIDSPPEMYSRPKKQGLIFKRNKRFYFRQWNQNRFERWNMNIQLQNLQINGEISKYFISARWLVTDSIGIFNAHSRKTVPKFSGLRWFFLFEDLCNGER